MPGRLKAVACRGEVSGLTTAGRNGVGLAGTDRVNIQAVETGREDAGDGLDGHDGVPVGEIDGGIGSALAIGGIEMGGQLLSAG